MVLDNADFLSQPTLYKELRKVAAQINLDPETTIIALRGGYKEYLFYD